MTKTYSFATANDAIRNGFVLADTKRYKTYRGCFINGYDTSGRGARGYSYGLRVEVPDDFTSNYLGAHSDLIFGETVSVSISTYSKTVQKASTILMFEPHVFRAAIEDAIHWTDKWFRAHPAAMEIFNAAQADHRQMGKARARVIG